MRNKIVIQDHNINRNSRFICPLCDNYSEDEQGHGHCHKMPPGSNSVTPTRYVEEQDIFEIINQCSEYAGPQIPNLNTKTFDYVIFEKARFIEYFLYHDQNQGSLYADHYSQAIRIALVSGYRLHSFVDDVVILEAEQ